jgi:hypothetical protein
VKRLWIALAGILLFGGCSRDVTFLRPEGNPRGEPQFHNRLRISENNDLVGV